MYLMFHLSSGAPFQIEIQFLGECLNYAIAGSSRADFTLHWKANLIQELNLYLFNVFWSGRAILSDPFEYELVLKRNEI